MGLVASCHKVEIPEGSLLRSCEGPGIPGWAQRGRLPSELLIEVADICAPRKCRHKGWGQATSQQDIPAQRLWRGGQKVMMEDAGKSGDQQEVDKVQRD